MTWRPGSFNTLTGFVTLDRPLPIRNVRRSHDVLLFETEHPGIVAPTWEECAAVLVRKEDGTFAGTISIPQAAHVRGWSGSPARFEWCWMEDATWTEIEDQMAGRVRG